MQLVRSVDLAFVSVIAFVLARICETHARAFFPGGRRFDAIRAQWIGLVHDVVEALEAAVDAAVGEQEGFRAFVEKRRPGWEPDPE